MTEYFNDEQLAHLAERRERLGKDAIAQTQAGWAALSPKMADGIESGVNPSSPAAQAIATPMDENVGGPWRTLHQLAQECGFSADISASSRKSAAFRRT